MSKQQKTDILNQIIKKSSEELSAGTLNNPRLYVREYLVRNGISVNERGEVVDNDMRRSFEIFDTMYLDYLQQASKHNLREKTKIPHLRSLVSISPEKVLQKALLEYISLERARCRRLLIQSFCCQTESRDQLRLFIKAVTGECDENDFAVLSHWMWLVKVKMMEREHSNHIMPILFGKQGAGKTIAINKLLGPLNSFRLNIALDQATDERYFKTMSENFVVVFDEMSGVSRSDIAALKKQITTDFNDYRPMGTNDIYKVRQSCSFIGTTNQPVAEQVIDPSGMRRFWQINCQDKLDWDAISSINYIEMWKGIDENKRDGYILDRINFINTKQEELKMKDDVLLFIEDNNLLPRDTLTKKVSSFELYQEYRSFCDRNGFIPMNSSWFGRKLVQHGLGKGVGIDPSTKKTINFFLVNSK
ncbi:MAG: VapE domain-containing protein [Sediminibacterium sp.]